jgi:hypothetical protein
VVLGPVLSTALAEGLLALPFPAVSARQIGEMLGVGSSRGAGWCLSAMTAFTMSIYDSISFFSSCIVRLDRRRIPSLRFGGFDER